MKRFRPKTFLFSELRTAEGDNVVEFVSMQADAADRTAKRWPGRPPGEAMKKKMAVTLERIRRLMRMGETDAAIAEAFDVPEDVVSEYRRSL